MKFKPLTPHQTADSTAIFKYLRVLHVCMYEYILDYFLTRVLGSFSALKLYLVYKYCGTNMKFLLVFFTVSSFTKVGMDIPYRFYINKRKINMYKH
jgi:predicted membrane-bound spermidine synthase